MSKLQRFGSLVLALSLALAGAFVVLPGVANASSSSLNPSAQQSSACTTPSGWAWGNLPCGTNPPTANCSHSGSSVDPSWFTYAGNPSSSSVCGQFQVSGSACVNGDCAGSSWKFLETVSCSNGSTVSAGGAYSGAPGSWQNVASVGACPTGSTLTGWTLTGYTSGAVYLSANVSLGAKCLAADFGSVAASYTGTTLAVRFQWVNSWTPTAWSLFYPDPGNDSGAAQQTMTPGVAAQTGYAGYYYQTWTVASAPSPLTLRLYAPPPSNYAGCDVTVTISTAAPITALPGQTGGAGDGSTCGVSFNILHDVECGVSWAFEDNTMATEWSTFSSTVKTHAPVSLVVGGISFVSSVFSAATGAGSYYAVNNGVGGTSACPANTACSGASYSLVGSLSSFGGSTLGGFLRTVLETGIWVSLLLICYRRATAAFGSKPDGGDD